MIRSSRSCRPRQPSAARRHGAPRGQRVRQRSARRAYAGVLSQFDAWLDGQKLDDAALAAYLAELHDAGRAASSAGMAVAAARLRAKLAGQKDPAGARTARVLAGYRRTAGDRGQASSFSAADLAAVLATCHRPRHRGRRRRAAAARVR